jgi:hypothetical protein
LLCHGGCRRNLAVVRGPQETRVSGDGAPDRAIPAGENSAQSLKDARSEAAAGQSAGESHDRGIPIMSRVVAIPNVSCAHQPKSSQRITASPHSHFRIPSSSQNRTRGLIK